MTPRVVSSVIAATLFVTATAQAQIVPPPPERTPPGKEYTPPAPPEPQPEAEAQPRDPSQFNRPSVQPIDLIERTADGTVVRLTRPAAWIAVAKLELREEKREEGARLIAQHAADMDRIVADNPDLLFKLKKDLDAFAPGMSMEDARAFIQGGDPIADPGLVGRLAEAGVISPLERRRVERAVTTYRDAVRDEVISGIDGNDIQQIIHATFRLRGEELLMPAWTTYERIVARLAPSIRQRLGDVALTNEQREAAESILRGADASDDANWAAAASKVIERVLTPDQQRQILRAALVSAAESENTDVAFSINSLDDC